MRRQAPPLDATEAFLAAARAPSFRAAADEIALSPSAFSRRIQLLENFVGSALFDRSGPTVQLTEAGARYFAEVAPAMDAIRCATARLREQATSRVLRIVTSHSLAVGWLIPRMSALQEEHDIELDLSISRDPQALTSGSADVAIWGGRNAECDFARDRLVDLSAVLVCGTRMANGREPPRSIAELSGHRLLAAKTPEHSWHRWFDTMGLDAERADPVMSFDTVHLVYEAAASGLGMALAIPLLSDRFIKERRLLPLPGPSMPLDLDYSIYYATPEVARRPLIRSFVRWLERGVAGSLAEFQVWSAPPVALHAA